MGTSLIVGIVVAMFMVGYNLAGIIVAKFFKKKTTTFETKPEGGEWVVDTMQGFADVMEKQELTSEQMATVSVLLAGTVASTLNAEEVSVRCVNTKNTYKITTTRGD